MFGDGTGGFPTSSSIGEVDSAYHIAVGDFNLDGKPDIATGNFPIGSVSILLGNGNGTFQTAVNYAIHTLTGQGYGITVGDFNRDSKPDLAVDGPHGVTIMLGNCDGTFHISNTYDGGNDSARSVLGDFNRDGNQDLAVANQGGPNHNNVSILLGNGNGMFQPATYYGLGTALGTVGITGGDFNGDGILDLATSDYISNTIVVLLGNGNGTFQTAVNYPVPFISYYLTVGDFNADGVLDLAAPSNNPGGVGVLIGNGDGTFQPSVKFNLPAGTDFVTVGDLNGDRKPDLIATNGNTIGVSILLNTCSCTPPDVTPSAPAQVCASSTGNTISIPDAGVGASYTWTNFGFNGAITSGANTRSITFTAGATGTMTLGVTATNANGCTASKLIYVPIKTGDCVPLISCNQPPVVMCRNVTVAAGASCTAIASIDNGSYDPNSGDTITLNQSPAGPYTLGTTTVTLTATDSHGASSSCMAVVTVVDQTAPTITLLGANPMTVECPTGFTDPGATAQDNCAGAQPVTASGSVNLSVPGSYTITYTANDGYGNTATTMRTVNVVDTTAPLLTLKPNLELWPPNHKYQTVTMSQMVASISDGCNTSLGINDVVIEKVTSDEPDNGLGDGDTANDIVIAANCQSVQLRAERAGGGNGRVYVVTLQVRDASGNTTRQDFKVSVPPNQSGAAAVQDAPVQTKMSGCP